MSGFFLRDRGPVLVLAAACAWLFLVGLGARDFWEPEEPEFALIARTMAEADDWIVPQQNGAWYAEKPPLVFWATLVATGGGAAFRAGPPWEGFLARLPSALAAVALVLGLYAFARGIWGRRAAFLAALVMATSAEFAWRARFLQTDMLFAAATAGAVMCFLAADHDPGARPRGRLVVAGWLLLAVAVLAKGPLGPVLAGITLSVHLALRGRAAAVRALSTPAHAAGLAVFAAVAVPWYLAVHARLGPDEGARFLHENLIVQNLGRTRDSYSHAQPPWYYAGALAGIALPWTPALAAGVVALVRRARRREPDALLLVSWIVPPLLFLSAVSSKQAKYLLPLWPALALATGVWLDRAAHARPDGRTLRWAIGLGAAAMACAGLAVLAAAILRPGAVPREAMPAIRAALPGAAACALGAAVVLVRLLLLVEPARAAADLAGTVAVGGGLVLALASGPANAIRSARAFCEEAARMAPADAAIAQYETFRSAFPYYLRRDTPVLKRDGDSTEEATRGQDRAARRAATLEAIRRAHAFLDAPGRGWIIAQRDYWERYTDSALRARADVVLARDVGGDAMVLLRERDP